MEQDTEALEQATEEFWTIAYDGEEALTHRPTEWTQEEAEDLLLERLQCVRLWKGPSKPRLFRITRSAVEQPVGARGAEDVE